MTSDIKIKYVNSTGKTDFEVLVYTTNFSLNTPKTVFSAWQVLEAQSEVLFDYPVSLQVGASYEHLGQTNIAGPFDAGLGSTWSISQDTTGSAAVLKESMYFDYNSLVIIIIIMYVSLFNSDTSAPSNPNNTIVIKNTRPKTWNGRTFDIGVYKNNRLLIVQKDVKVDDQEDFQLQPKLFFAVARNIKIGQTFTSAEISSAFADYDLSDYPDGIVVTLSQAKVGGQYSFSASPM